MSADNIEAINTYIVNTGATTPEAVNLQSQWRLWYDNLNFITKALDSTNDEASTRRNLFNAANMNPANLDTAADLTPAQKVKAQSEIAKSTVLTPTQKAAALKKSPNTPTTPGVPGSAVNHATIRQGSKGSDVIAWQAIIGVKGDGTFGAGTASATRAWQKSHGLTADGVVGPKTWSAALGTPVQEAPSGGVATGPTPPFIPAQASSPPFAPVSPSVAAHTAAVNSGTTPPATAAVKAAAAALTSSSAGHTALKIAIPAVAVLAGGWFFGPVGVVVGAAAGLFGSSKV